MKRLLTVQLQKSLCRLLRDGIPTKTAAEACGVTARTITSWLSQAEEVEADAQLVEFASAVSRARAEARTTLVGRIIEAGKTDWRANAYLLARLSPEEFGVAATETTNFAASSVHISTQYVPQTNGSNE